ncbi:MAG: prolyl oligopeptidase family serine peptidase, partial [Bacteroidales bacterium]|nr:prolyl oligopeptidase family serine peptidase [Bacteroidales bacterium]
GVITDDIYCFSVASRWLIASERDGYRHLYLYDFDGKLLRQLTKGNYEVNRLYGVDERHGRVYFSANYSAPYNIEVMSVGLDGRGLRRLAYELQAKGGVCRALFSDDYRRVILIHSAAGTAPRYCEYALDGESEQLLSVIEGNEDMQTRLQADDQPQRRFGKMAVGRYRTPFPDTIQPAGDGTDGTQARLNRLSERAAGFDTLYYWVMQPARMEAGRRYPVLMFLYGGPGSQQVLNQYGGLDYWWYSYLVSQGYIVLCVDNRGTGGRGEAFKKCTYLQLGRYETQDQMAVVCHIAAQWDFVDPARIAIWGWSYGGFMSSSCLFRGDGLWKAAMAVAPVTSWRYYDNVYTERFMRTPAENPGGYDANSPIYWADKQQGAYLLAHGTGDDNVHFQNSMMLVDALQAHLKPFAFQAYPNRNHSLIGGSAREHLYETMTRFLKENL